MLLNELKTKYNSGEPIFLSEIPSKSKGYLRQQVKNLTDRGFLTRVCNGVSYLPYKTILGTDGKMSAEKYIEKKFLFKDGKEIGYYTGLYLASLYGFTTQNPACYEVCSNSATTKQRKISIDGVNIVIYKPVALITNDNIKTLRFLDLMLNIDKYCELPIEVAAKKLKRIMADEGINMNHLYKYISLHPLKIYRNICNYNLAVK